MTKYALYLLTYILFTIFCCLGTVMHESGHYFAAYAMGLNPILQYSQTSYGVNALNNMQHFDTRLAIIHAAGPFMNILVGTVGYWLLIKEYKKAVPQQLLQILFTAVSFFWSREIVIFFSDVLLTRLPHYQKASWLTDERSLSGITGLPQNTISIVLGICAMYVCTMAVFKYLPSRLRLSFTVWGLLGCVTGYVLWFYAIGPVLLPIR